MDALTSVLTAIFGSGFFSWLVKVVVERALKKIDGKQEERLAALEKGQQAMAKDLKEIGDNVREMALYYEYKERAKIVGTH